jgi:hypothetical protein
MVEGCCRAGGALRLLWRLQLKPELIPEPKRNHEMLVRLLADPCCLLLKGVGSTALLVKLIQRLNHWLK